jgi:hypothetical protein
MIYDMRTTGTIHSCSAETRSFVDIARPSPIIIQLISLQVTGDTQQWRTKCTPQSSSPHDRRHHEPYQHCSSPHDRRHHEPYQQLLLTTWPRATWTVPAVAPHYMTTGTMNRTGSCSSPHDHRHHEPYQQLLLTTWSPAPWTVPAATPSFSTLCEQTD